MNKISDDDKIHFQDQLNGQDTNEQSQGDGVLVLVQVVDCPDTKVVLLLGELHIPRRLLVSPREIVQDKSYKQICIKAKRQKRRFIIIADPRKNRETEKKSPSKGKREKCNKISDEDKSIGTK